MGAVTTAAAPGRNRPPLIIERGYGPTGAPACAALITPRPGGRTQRSRAGPPARARAAPPQLRPTAATREI